MQIANRRRQHHHHHPTIANSVGLASARNECPEHGFPLSVRSGRAASQTNYLVVVVVSVDELDDDELDDDSVSESDEGSDCEAKSVGSAFIELTF